MKNVQGDLMGRVELGHHAVFGLRSVLAALAVAVGIWPFVVQADEDYVFPEDEDAAAFITSNVVATFYHELGHALIDVLALPVLGKEEDAADTLSTLLIHSTFEEESAVAMVFDAASAFFLYADEADAESYEMPYWDEHSLDMQRYYHLACLFYGANPDKRDAIAKEMELPEDRAEKCPEEFALADESWGVMLEGHEPGNGAKGLRLVKNRSKDPTRRIDCCGNHGHEQDLWPAGVD